MGARLFSNQFDEVRRDCRCFPAVVVVDGPLENGLFLEEERFSRGIDLLA